MKKLFYFLILLAIVVAIDHPKINQLYDDTLGNFKLFAREGIKTAKNPGGGKVFREVEKHFANYSKAEIKMIDKLTKNNQEVLAFRKTFCVGGEFNPVIYGTNLRQFCSIIEKHKRQLSTVIK